MKKSQARTAKVLIILMASMTVGGFVLMSLDKQTPARGAYSLASYLRLDPIEEVVLNPVKTQKANWKTIEIYYSQTNQGDLVQMAAQGRTGFHFLVCNGNGADDGQIEATTNWAGQKFAAGTDSEIRICVVANGKSSPVTGSQMKRTSALVDTLSRNFRISSEKINYPNDWAF